MSILIKIKKCIINFPSLNKPLKKYHPNDPDKFGARIVLDKINHKNVIKQIDDFIKEFVDKSKKFKTSFRDGDLDGTQYNNGTYYFQANNNRIIPLFDINCNRIYDYSNPRNFDIVNAIVDMYFTNNNGTQYVSFSLKGIMFVAKGENPNDDEETIANIFKEDGVEIINESSDKFFNANSDINI